MEKNYTDFSLLELSLGLNGSVTSQTIDTKIPFDHFKFSGGEVHLKIKINPTEKVRINCRINNSDDLMLLVLAVDALRGMNVKYIEAFIPYIPYARQDRRMVYGEPLSIKAFAQIINSLKLDRVICYDVHSEVTLALIDNIEHHNNFSEVLKFLIQNTSQSWKKQVIVSPDAGAYKKVFKMCQHINYSGEIIIANKLRDTSSGKILSIKLNGDVSGMDCIIVDDIIDGGNTFIELAVALKSRGANNLYLFASHGIFSKGVDELLKHFKAIGTTNSFKENQPEPIKVINLKY